MAKSAIWSQSNTACFSVTEDRNKGRKTHKQAASVGGCRKGLAEHLKGGNTAFGGDHEI